MTSIAQIVEKARQKGPAGTAAAVVQHLGQWVRRLREAGEDLLFGLARLPLTVLPTRTLARLKHWLTPMATLDYSGAVIRLHADSELAVQRARACAKEPETVEWIEENVKPGDVLYDVGANVGAYSLVAAKHSHGQATVYAFEPSFSTYYHLCRNVLLNRCEDAIRPYMIALADRSGQVVFNYQSIDAGSSLHTLGEDRDYKGDRFTPRFRQHVVGFSIDRLVSEFGFAVPNHIKLDVDGTELDVLRGASETLRDSAVRSVLIEVFDGNEQADLATRFLVERGFVLASRRNHGGGPFWNYVFKRAG